MSKDCFNRVRVKTIVRIDNFNLKLVDDVNKITFIN